MPNWSLYGATQGTLRLDLTGVSHTSVKPSVQRVRKRQVRLLWRPTVLTGSIGIRPNGTYGQPPGDVVLGFSLDGFILSVHLAWRSIRLRRLA